MELYPHAVVYLRYKYRGFAFYDYHRSFAAKAAVKLAQFQAALIGASWIPSSSAAILWAYVPRSSPFSPSPSRQTGAPTQMPDTP